MDKKTEIKDRRKKLSGLIFKGIEKQKAFKIIAKDFDCSPRTVKNDWASRDEWMLGVWDLDDENKIINDTVSEHRYIKEKFYELYDEAQYGNNKLGALKGAKECNKELIDILQSLGIVSEEPNKLELTGKDGGPLEITDMARIADDWEDEGE